MELLLRVITRQVSRDLHRVVENATDAYQFRTYLAKQQDMPWTTHHPAIMSGSIPTVTQMVATNTLTKFRAMFYADTSRVRCYVSQGNDKQPFIAHSCVCSKTLGGSIKYGSNIVLSSLRKPKLRHLDQARPCLPIAEMKPSSSSSATSRKWPCSRSRKPVAAACFKD